MKATIITGVSGGMGYAAARQLSREGYLIFGLDRKEPEPLEGLYFIPTDLTDPVSVNNAFQAVQDILINRISGEYTEGGPSRENTGLTECPDTAGMISSIIHLAGMYGLDSLIEISEEEFNRIFQVNLFAVYRINKTFLPLLRPGSRIIITTSELAPLDPLPFTGLYAVTKAALDKYAQTLHMELQLLGHSVIILRPGAVNTRMLDASVSALNAFCSHTRLYPCNAGRFRRIVNRVEARSIPPEKIACVISETLSARHPRPVRHINRNPLLLMMNLLPRRLQEWLIRNLLKA